MPTTFRSTVPLSFREERFPTALNCVSQLTMGQTVWFRSGDRLNETIFRGYVFKPSDDGPNGYMIFEDEVYNGFATDRGVAPYGEYYNGFNMLFDNYADAALSFYPSDDEIEIEENAYRERITANSREQALDRLMPILEAFGYDRDDAESAMDSIQDMLADLGVVVEDWNNFDNQMSETYINGQLKSLHDTLVRFPNRTDEEKSELFGLAALGMFIEHEDQLEGIENDDTFAEVMDFASVQAVDGDEFLAIMDDLYWSRVEPEIDLASYDLGASDALTEAEPVFKSVRINPDLDAAVQKFLDSEAAQQAAAEITEAGKEALQDTLRTLGLQPYQQEALDAMTADDEPTAQTDVEGFLAAMERIGEVLDAFPDMPVKVKFSLHLIPVGDSPDLEILAELIDNLKDAVE